MEAGTFDACICQLGLMLFVDPASALRAVRRALEAGGRLAVVVFTTPEANPFMATPLRLMLHSTGKAPPAPGKPGIFALGGEGVLRRIYRAIVADAPEPVRAAAWAQVAEFLDTLEDTGGFHGPGEVRVACGVAGATEAP